MKEYFIKKLSDNTSKVNRLKNAIIEAATNMDIKQLQILPEQLQILHKEKHNWITDLCMYCSVDNVIEINNLEHKILDDDAIRYFYRYTSKGVSIQDRDKLVKEFGYSLKEAKII